MAPSTSPAFGVKLMSELRSPAELIAHATGAEERGFDLVAISDHIHPWLSSHGHSPSAWVVLGAVADRTERIEIATGLTCPILRYHPAIVAQMAATVATMSEGRFTLALGAGERLNEHVTTDRWPATPVRHEMLAEAVEVMQALWTGDVTNHRGEHYLVDDAQLYDLPDEPIDIVIGVSGSDSLDLACSVDAAGIMAVDPEPGLVDGWTERGGAAGRTYTEVPFAAAATEEEGLELAHRFFRFGAPGWSVMAELPNVRAFDAATDAVRPADLADDIPHGPDADTYVDAVRTFLDAGFERVSFVPVGDDLDRFWSIATEVAAELRAD